jgi:hypothetical protein
MGMGYSNQPLEAVMLIIPGNEAEVTPFDVCMTGVKDG